MRETYALRTKYFGLTVGVDMMSHIQKRRGTATQADLARLLALPKPRGVSHLFIVLHEYVFFQ